MRQNLDAILRGQQTLARLRTGQDRLERIQSVLDLYGKELKRWEQADSATRTTLVERTDSVSAHVE